MQEGDRFYVVKNHVMVVSFLAAWFLLALELEPQHTVSALHLIDWQLNNWQYKFSSGPFSCVVFSESKTSSPLHRSSGGQSYVAVNNLLERIYLG